MKNKLGRFKPVQGSMVLTVKYCNSKNRSGMPKTCNCWVGSDCCFIGGNDNYYDNGKALPSNR